jgi:two-component system chemotaxis sensor kinase CheA
MVDLSKFKGVFVSEAEDNLQKLNENLLSLEKNIKKKGSPKTAKALLNDLMRSSHTIKGSSASMGYNKMAFLTHVMEDVFDSARNNIIIVDQSIIDIIFTAIDKLESSLNSIKVSDTELDVDELSKELKAITGVNTIGVGKSKRGGEQTKQEPITQKLSDEEKQEQKAAENFSEDLRNVTKLDYIKVPVKRLDALMDMVEELLIDKMRLQQLSNRIPELQEISDHVSLLISGIQYEVMQARLVPLDQVFARFPRMIRDLAQKQKKSIEFVVIGGETELDRTVVDKLGEPLIHLLRNAVDHGVKDKGVVKLEAIRKSDHVLFAVENRGINIVIDQVKAAAIKRGIINAKEAEGFNEQQIINLLFHPKLSTNERITEISGRGVGLSVVKRFVESLNGRVMVENYENGARFILELPLTLAIINSLFVQIKEKIYAIPFTSIERSVEVKPENIKRMADRNMAVIDGKNVPLIDLKEIFGVETLNIAKVEVKGSTQTEEKNKDETKINKQERQKEEEQVHAYDKPITVVLVRKEEEVAGIVVDDLVDEQEIIVKPFSPILHNVNCFSGSTILGDGQVILILDVLGLLKYINN